MTIKSIFQTKNTYSTISKNYAQNNICINPQQLTNSSYQQTPKRQYVNTKKSRITSIKISSKKFLLFFSYTPQRCIIIGLFCVYSSLFISSMLLSSSSTYTEDRLRLRFSSLTPYEIICRAEVIILVPLSAISILRLSKHLSVS